MHRIWKKYGVLLAAGGMAVCMAAGLAMGIRCSRDYTQKMVVEAAEPEMAYEPQGLGGPESYEMKELSSDPDSRLYKEAVDEDIAEKVCEKYGLDCSTVLVGDMTREMRNYEEALWLKKEMGDCPLFDRELKEGAGSLALSSLECYIDDVYAFGGGDEVIKSMCEEFDIDPEKACISDLTEEQLIQIGKKAYDTSDHPKE